MAVSETRIDGISSYYSKTKKTMSTRIISGMILCRERKRIRYEINEPQKNRNGN